MHSALSRTSQLVVPLHFDSRNRSTVHQSRVALLAPLSNLGQVSSQARATVSCAVRSSGAAAAIQNDMQPGHALLFRVVEALFKIQPLFQLAAQKARSKIADRGRSIGVDMDAEVAALQKVDWSSRVQEISDTDVQLPAYYTMPFHAYPAGNLCWEAAHQVEAAAQAVHANVMDPEGKALDARGDANLRASYSARMQDLLPESAGTIHSIVDLGCASGLSSLELLRAFPQASVTGIDLSPYFLAVGQHLHGSNQALEFRHAAAEATGLPGGSVDLVSCCLVLHELPQHATRAIVQEAFRILRPGGVLSIMEMDPCSSSWQRVFGNPIAFAAFKSTEPWLLDYVSLDLPDALQQAGFKVVGSTSNTPRHKTVLAQKPG